MASIIKKTLGFLGLYDTSLSLYQKLTKTKEQFQYKILYKAILNIPLASNFYIFFSKSFNYEAKMFVSARKNYLEQQYQQKQNFFLLRRNIHRIEKGLLMKNRRSVFALDYILLTVQLFKNINSTTDYNEQLQWSFDILSQYFEVTDNNNPTIKEAYNIFINISFETKGLLFAPYKKTNQNIEGNRYDILRNIAINRKSVRYYNTEVIPDRAIIDKALAIAQVSPSSCNRQPYTFKLIDNTNLAQKICTLAGGTTGFINQISAVAVVVGNINVSPTITDRHLMYIDGSLAAMNFMMALESLNVDSCPINWPENSVKDSTIRKILSLKQFERPIMLITYGYAEKDSMLACSTRKTLDQLRQYI